MLKKILPGVISFIAIMAIMWFMVQVALDAFDREWESRCPVWHEVGSQEYLKCMSRE